MIEMTSDVSQTRHVTCDSRLGEIADAIGSRAVKVVSTDVFDTLVWRSVPKPVDVFQVLGERLAHEGVLARRASARTFASLRVELEFEARMRRGRSNGQSEVTLEEIYELLPEWLYDASAGRHRALELELAVERELVFPDPDVVALLADCTAMGKRVVAVSDTYFSEVQLRSLLEQPGCEALTLDRVFTSSEYRENKSGGLFPLMLRDLDVAPGDVLHFGDNRVGDVEIPAGLGIQAFHFSRYPAPLDALLESERRFTQPQPESAAQLITQGRLIAARTKAVSRRPEVAQPPSLAPYWRFGAGVLGPVFTGFADWAHREAVAAGATQVLCLMREGAFLSELIAASNTRAGGHLDARPLWLNRRLCLRAGIESASPEAFEPLLPKDTPQTAGEFLETLGLDTSALPAYREHLGTRLSDPTVREGLIDAICSDPLLSEQVIAGSRRLRDRIVRLIDREAREGEPLVVVDLGWGGTIQGELTRILAAAGRPRQTIGLYLMTGAHAARQAAQGAEIHGFIGDYGKPDWLVAETLRSPEILEQICMPEHGTQLDLDEQLQPVIGPLLTPPAQALAARAVRAGIAAFASDVSLAPGPPDPSQAGAPALAPLLGGILLRLIADPTGEEVSSFGAWRHDGGEAGETETLAPAAQAVGLRHLTPRQLVDLPASHLYWPFALAALVDAELPSLMAAAVAGEVRWDALASPLETGEFTVQAAAGVSVDGVREVARPDRNRHGLSSVRAMLTAPQITAVDLKPGTRPAILRIDWITLHCHVQGDPAGVQVRIAPGANEGLVEAQNSFALGPCLFVTRGGATTLRLDLSSLTPRVICRVEVECAFAAVAIGEVLPAVSGSRDVADADTRLRHQEQAFAELREAAERNAGALRDTEAQLHEVYESLSWRITAPLRSVKRRTGT